MQATDELGKFPVQVVAVVFSVLVALILGGAGGYWLKTLSPTVISVSAPAASAAQTGSVGQAKELRESQVQRDTFAGPSGRNELAGEPAQGAAATGANNNDGAKGDDTYKLSGGKY